ncbi:MAG: prepilin-type N-terminal cleavage/methylation domain-containing protein, partial [Comamonas sp.]|nr:prepilin-type N-terminal cleavage/methylation domain-containing protein [Comamonas sp.]
MLHAELLSLHLYKPRLRQQGFSLVELMVGMAVGLLVMAAASVALLASRNLSVTVSDASHLQQQASYVLRIIGLQLRQAGGLHLNLNLN